MNQAGGLERDFSVFNFNFHLQSATASRCFARMKATSILLGGLAVLGLFTGCGTPIPPGAERGPRGTMAFFMNVEASEPGAAIEANGEYMGKTPVRLKIFGDPDGTFHDFGSYFFVVRALPASTNQFAQIRVFRTGRGSRGEDTIPGSIYFDMNQKQPENPPPGAPPYGYPDYGPHFYFYGPSPYFYGPHFFLPPPHLFFPWHHRR